MGFVQARRATVQCLEKNNNESTLRSFPFPKNLLITYLYVLVNILLLSFFLAMWFCFDG